MYWVNFEVYSHSRPWSLGNICSVGDVALENILSNIKCSVLRTLCVHRSYSEWHRPWLSIFCEGFEHACHSSQYLTLRCLTFQFKRLDNTRMCRWLCEGHQDKSHECCGSFSLFLHVLILN